MHNYEVFLVKYQFVEVYGCKKNLDIVVRDAAKDTSAMAIQEGVATIQGWQGGAGATRGSGASFVELSLV